MSASVGGCPEVNKFEQVSSDDHHMSLAGGGSQYSDVPCLGVGGYTVRSMHDGHMRPPVIKQTDRTESITFLGAVTDLSARFHLETMQRCTKEAINLQYVKVLAVT